MLTQDPLYTHGRLSAPVTQHGASAPRRDLIETLRSIRRQGREDLLGIERYDPDFSLKLSECNVEQEAVAYLEEWLEKRLSVLKVTRDRLHHAWAEEIAKSGGGS